jgi:hypothetical protein
MGRALRSLAEGYNNIGMTTQQRIPPVLRDHRRHGKTLVPPLAELNVTMLDWEGVWLPEHLWLAYLMHGRDIVEASRLFNAVSDHLDNFFRPAETRDVFLGYISDFHRFAQSRRRKLASHLHNSTELAPAFGRDFLALLALYPEGPAHWLGKSSLSENDYVTATALLRELITTLRPGKSRAATHCRVLGFNRLLKHRRVYFSKDVMGPDLARALENYPNTNQEDTAHVEQFVRVTMMSLSEVHKLTNWSTQFWNANFMMMDCR